MSHSVPRWGLNLIKEAGLWLSDVTTGNTSTTKHGLAPKLPNDASKFLDGTGAWTAPSVGGTGPIYDSGPLGVDTATIDTGAGGVPAGYNMLEIVIVGRTDEAVKISTCALTFNADSGANYTRQYAGGGNTTGLFGAETANTSVPFALPGSTFLASAPGGACVTVPSYALTTFFKVLTLMYGLSSTTAADSQAVMEGGLWRSTAAITRVTIGVVTAGKKLTAGSRMLIYGR